jgi:hypothetical protein
MLTKNRKPNWRNNNKLNVTLLNYPNNKIWGAHGIVVG